MDAAYWSKNSKLDGSHESGIGGHVNEGRMEMMMMMMMKVPVIYFSIE